MHPPGRDADGKIVPVTKTDAQWRAELTADQYRILRESGTERAGTGPHLGNKAPGTYVCVGCGLPLFESGTKFESGSGWPSFFKPIAEDHITNVEDYSHGMVRVENRCAGCDGHLGHVFPDGPRPTGLRYCMNGAALAFVPEDA